jgi:hypothetical protein
MIGTSSDENAEQVTLRSLVASAWRDAPPVLRRFAFSAWGVGFVAAAGSFAADLQGWWGGLQFASNIVSEIICALIALPIALVVVGQLAQYQVKEMDRARLDVQFRSARAQLVTAVRAAREHIQIVEREVVASTNEFVRAAKVEDGVVADLALANETARRLRAQMDTQQWIMYEHIVTPLRILGDYLQSLLVERDRNGDFARERTEFAKLAITLDAALDHQRQIMTNGHALFGTRLAADGGSSANKLRDVALEHVRSIDRLLELCDELETYADGAATTPKITR